MIVYRSERAARRAGGTLLARLGAGWNLTIYENLGWHYTCRLGEYPGLLVTQIREGVWWAYIDGDFPGAVLWDAKADSPELAISSALKEMNAELGNRTALYASILERLRAPRPSGPQLYVNDSGRIIGQQTDITDYVKESKA